MVGKLFIIATPIGNLGDITLRALEVLRSVDMILAEDTRVTKKLLSHYEIDRRILSYHQHSSDQKKLEILAKLNEGQSLALVTDAGTPGISDPGNELVDFILSQNPAIKIIPIPGPSALTAALSVSGFRTDKFVFFGFLPKKKRQKLFGWLKSGKVTFAFYESPKRLLKTLKTLSDEFGKDKRVFVAREMTKKFEESYRGSIAQVLEALESNTASQKGEVVVVIEG